MEFKEVQKLVYIEYVKNKYEENWNLARMRLNDNPGFIDLAELGLVVTEIAEAMEDIRKGRMDHVGEELADTIIRVLNLSSRLEIDIENEILSKHEKNMKREALHNKRI